MPQDHSKTSVVESTLEKSHVHDYWEDKFRNPDNEKFYDLAFDFIARKVGQPGSRFLDLGCGSCAHSMRLAKLGYRVHATDLSELVVAKARQNVDRAGLGDKITVSRENALSMNFEDESFDHVMAWGVLMHVPEMGGAIEEMTRVLRSGGKLVISESNAFSVQSRLIRQLRRLRGKDSARRKWTPAGFENWEDSEAGELLSREADIPWLVKKLQACGFTIETRTAGEFTEIYSLLSPRLKKVVHLFNRGWFRFPGLASPAKGNIIIARKN